jgi:hypothetical protein
VLIEEFRPADRTTGHEVQSNTVLDRLYRWRLIINIVAVSLVSLRERSRRE